MKLSAAQKLVIYRQVLVRYEASQDPKAVVQRRLIAALELELAQGEG